MNRVILITLSCFSIFFSCQDKLSIENIQAKRIEINDSIPSAEEFENFIEPYRSHIDSSLNAVLCYSPKVYTKNDGELNTAIGNMMADAVYEMAGPIFSKRSTHELDFVLLNHGGIRSVLPAGEINARTAYKIMPFENEVVVVGLKGLQVQQLLEYLKKAKRAHPISKELSLILNESYDIESVSIKGKPIDNDRIYFVATSDYLYNGGDRMHFFQPNEFYIELDYKVRNVLIDYFKQVDTLDIGKDERFIKKVEP